MNKRSGGEWKRSFNDRRNPNWQRPYVNQSSPYEMENKWNVICTIFHNYGHVAMNFRRRTSRGNAGPWRASEMTCFHCHKSGHIARFCRARMNQPVNQSADQKGKKKVDVEETYDEMNTIWRKKSEEKPSKDSNSSPSVENPSPVN